MFNQDRKKISHYFNTLRLDLGPVRDLAERLHQLSVSSTAACDSLQIGRPRCLNRGLYLDFDVIEWSKLVEIWGTQKETKQTPTERLQFTYGQLHLITSNYSPRN